MTKFVTFTKYEITDVNGNVSSVSTGSGEEYALSLLNLRRETDNNKYYPDRTVVKDIKVLGTEEVDVDHVENVNDDSDCEELMR